MNTDRLSLGDFILHPDTVPLLIRDGSLQAEAFRLAHGIRPGTALAGDYRVDYVNRAKVPGILAETGEGFLSMLPVTLGLLDEQSLEAAGILQARRHPFLDLRGRGVLLGFVDTGIDFTLPVFRYEDGTSKIQAIWDQSLSGQAPQGFHFGAEFGRQALDEALALENPRSAVPHRDSAGHGTFLASAAAGRETGAFSGAAPDAEIVAVKLRQAPPYFYERYLIPPEQEHAYCSSDFLLGVQYILNQAARLGRPVALCVALGTNLGGHDGLGLVEEFLSRVSSATGVAIACAAGNESQSAHHAQGRLAYQGQTQRVELMAGGRGQDIFLCLWSGPSDRLAVSLTSPGGEEVPNIPVRSGTSFTTNLTLEPSRVGIEYYLPVRGSGDQLTVVRILRPTPGIWTITVHGEIILNGSYHLWLPLTGLGPPDTVFLRPSPDYTVVTPAAALGVVTCGAYDSRSGALYPQSSWGPTRMPRMAPDLVAPGVEVGAYFPTGYGIQSGTSAAAALTAGACALMLQWGIVDGNDPSLTSNRIRANLIRGCTRSAGLDYPNPQWGYGALNLFHTLDLIRTPPSGGL